jgi:hypothetical protein
MGRTISGSISLPCPGFFSPFPHGTGYAIGDRLYLALRSGLRRFTRGSTCSVLLRYHLNSSWFLSTGLSPAAAGLSNPVRLTFPDLLFYQPRMETSQARKLESPQFEVPTLPRGMVVVALQPQPVNRLVWAPPRSLAATCGISSISFPLVT